MDKFREAAGHSRTRAPKLANFERMKRSHCPLCDQSIWETITKSKKLQSSIIEKEKSRRQLELTDMKKYDGDDIKKMVENVSESVLGITFEEYGDLKRFGGIEIDVKEANKREADSLKEVAE